MSAVFNKDYLNVIKENVLVIYQINIDCQWQDILDDVITRIGLKDWDFAIAKLKSGSFVGLEINSQQKIIKDYKIDGKDLDEVLYKLGRKKLTTH